MSVISRPFNGPEQEQRIDYILTRQYDRNFVSDVKVHWQSFPPPFSDHNIVAAHVKLLGRMIHNCRVKTVVKGRIDLQCLTTDPDIGQEVAAAAAEHFRKKSTWQHLCGRSKAQLNSLRPSCRLLSSWCRKRSATGPSKDGADRFKQKTSIHSGWRSLMVDTQITELRRAVRRACKKPKRLRGGADTRFLKRHIQENGGAVTLAWSQRIHPTSRICGGGGNEEGRVAAHSRRRETVER